MGWFDNIKEWGELPVQKRYNVLIGGIIVVLCAIIINYERKLNKKDEDMRVAVNGLVVRYTAREASLENKVEICNQAYLQYLQKSEKEYRELLFEAKQLKAKIDENIH